MLVLDSFVFCMTLYKSIVLSRPNGVNILDILLRDGELLAARKTLFFPFEPNKYSRSDIFRVGFDFSFSFDSGSTGAQGDDGDQFSQYTGTHGEGKCDIITLFFF